MQDAAIYNNTANPTYAIVVIAISILISFRIEKKIWSMLWVNAGICLAFYYMAHYFTNDIWLFWFLDIVARVSVALVAYNLDKQNYALRFLKLTFVFAVISLVFYILVQINPSMVMKFASSSFDPKGYSGTFYGGIVYLTRTNELMRNSGIFMEPGLYSIVLSVAIYILILRQDIIINSISIRKSVVMLLLFIVTMFTTQSTSGIVNILVCVICVLFTKYKRYFEISISRKVIFIIAFAAILILIDFFNNGSESLLAKLIVDKINIDINVISNFNNQYDKMTSGSWRLITVVEGIEIIKKNPLGVGLSNVERMFTAGASGATFIREMGGIGLLPVLYKLLIQIVPMVNNRRNWPSLVAIAFIFLNYQLNQSNVIYPAIFTVLLVSSKTHEMDRE